MKHTVFGMGVGLLGIVLGVSATADDGRSPLDAAVALRLPATLPSCGINTLVAKLSETSHVAMGFEESQPDCFATFPRFDMTDDDSGLPKMTVRQALDQLTVLAPDYQWREMRGVAVIRPVSAWMDPADALNGRLAPFQVAEATVTQTLATILRWPSTQRLPGPSLRFDVPPFAMAFNGGTTVEALNELVRARGRTGWSARTWPGADGTPWLSLTIRTFNFRHEGAISMGAPKSRLLATR